MFAGDSVTYLIWPSACLLSPVGAAMHIRQPPENANYQSTPFKSCICCSWKHFVLARHLFELHCCYIFYRLGRIVYMTASRQTCKRYYPNLFYIAYMSTLIVKSTQSSSVPIFWLKQTLWAHSIRFLDLHILYGYVRANIFFLRYKDLKSG